jgi:hypothetical protein
LPSAFSPKGTIKGINVYGGGEDLTPALSKGEGVGMGALLNHYFFSFINVGRCPTLVYVGLSALTGIILLILFILLIISSEPRF